MAATRHSNRRALPTGRTRTSAQLADRYDLYQRSVQCVEAEIDFVDNTYKKLRGTRARLLREDFCGTANTSCEWVRRRKGNVAVGVDLDPIPMAWGKKHNLSQLNEEQRSRLDLHRGDVLDAGKHAVAKGKVRGFDAVLAMNFSYWCFKKREGPLLKYFRAVHRSLDRRGVFFLDFYGGSDSMKILKETRRIGARRGGENASPGFKYVWEHASYNPINGDITCFIHFRFADGSEMKRAFRYDWRLWTVPEVRDVLTDAGFKRVTVYWEGDDGNGGGNGVFRAATKGEACASFISYITAEA